MESKTYNCINVPKLSHTLVQKQLSERTIDLYHLGIEKLYLSVRC